MRRKDEDQIYSDYLDYPVYGAILEIIAIMLL